MGLQYDQIVTWPVIEDGYKTYKTGRVEAFLENKVAVETPPGSGRFEEIPQKAVVNIEGGPEYLVGEPSI